MTIHEPATFATDCLLAFLAAFLAAKLHKHARENLPASAAQIWLARALGLLAISALVGGTYHGFSPEIPRTFARLWWWLTLVSINLVSAALGLSLLHALVPPHRQNPWRIFIFLKLLSFAVLAAIYLIFRVAIIDYGSTMLICLATALILRRDWWRWMSATVLLSTIAATVQQLKWAPSTSFNHNDLYHVIQALALIALYQAGLRLPSLHQHNPPSN